MDIDPRPSIRASKRMLLALAAASALVCIAIPAAMAGAGERERPSAGTAGSVAASYPDAVVLVSGFTTATPFTIPDPSCDGLEGSSWDPTDGVAAALKAAGYNVFTAPIQSNSGGLPAPCTGNSVHTPRSDATINSDGQLGDNGRALAMFLEFLGEKYGVERVQLVGHSDGGLWSRAAITKSKHYSDLVDIRSLTTLGTPHLGSWVADAGIGVLELRCGPLGDELKAECKQLISAATDELLAALGGAATRELTNDFLTGWNVRQRLGRCPVAGIAGTALNTAPAEPFASTFTRYYTPFDGVVGEASALNQATTDWNGYAIPAPEIKGWIDGGSFDVVHSEGVSVLNQSNPLLLNLLNSAEVSAQVVALVEDVAEDGPLCTKAKSGERTNQTATLELPLYQLVGQDSQGRLPVPNDYDPVLVQDGLNLFCGSSSTPLTVISLAGTINVNGATANPQVAFPVGCESKIFVAEPDGSAAASDTAIMARIHPDNYAKFKVKNHDVRVKIEGPKVKELKVKTLRNGSWQRVTLDEKGRGELKGSGDFSRVRISAQTKPGKDRSTAEAAIAR